MKIISKIQISINFKKVMLNCFVFSVALAWNGNHFVLHKGNNSNKKNVKSA